ncbi:MAG: Cro/Cl family transcriptional regulator [Alkaliphilus sp.]|nr:sugar-binding transcriptional regulator [bacterium AH-315-G05]PHS30503.1 MAG: Cro/Cl family transcriptional regulator [Alkaliphilus sp.]
MEDLINVQKIIVPEIFELLEKRYDILRTVAMLHPIGRRSLANTLKMGERAVRTEIDFLKSENLVEVTTAGMCITYEGINIIEKLKSFIYVIRGISELERKISRLLGIKEVIIVPGNIEEDEYVIDDIGKKASKVIEKVISDNDIIAVTGGSTMSTVAQGISKTTKTKNIVVVPARGGLGKNVENQANTIAAEIANNLNGKYHLLHVSDTLCDEALASILHDPKIKEIISKVKKANLLLFGIGRADKMARERELSKEILLKLQNKNAVAEAFGYFFNKEGEIVYEMNTIGISLNDFVKTPCVIGTAGGVKKAEAIMAISKLNKNMILVTDEGAAREIINIST